MQKIRKYRIEGVATLTGRDGKIHHKIMIRVSPHGYKREHWLDVPDDSSYQIGDEILIRKVEPYQIMQEEGECTS